MRRLLLAVIAAASTVALMQIASAADLPRKAPAYAPAPPPAFSWTGCYAGVNIGAGRQKNTPLDPLSPDLDLGSSTGTGVVGGGQIGCDYQFPSTGWVIGVQGMFDGSGVDGNHFFPIAFGGTNTETYASKTDWFGTVTGRIGYAVVPQALLYVKGGGAWVHTKYSDTDPSGTVFPPFVGTASTTRSGWLVGGGFEYAFWRNWSGFVEYNHMDFGHRNLALTYDCGSSCGFFNPYTFRDKQTFETILVGVNWRFGGP